MLALRATVTRANAMEAHAIHASAGSAGTRVFQIGRDERCGRSAAIDASKQQRRGGFKHGKRRTAQKVGEADEDPFFAAANREREAGVRIKLNAEARRAAIAAEARKHALKE